MAENVSSSGNNGLYFIVGALVVIVGAAEVVWLFEGSGLTLVQHTLRGWFGGG